MTPGVRLPELNLVALSGRVTRDAELFFTQSGLAKLTMRIAVNRRVKDSKTGEWKDDVFYIDVVAWKELAERGKEKAKKGTPVMVEGRLSGREYDDKSGNKRAVLEVMANRIQFLAQAAADDGSPKKAAAELAADAQTGVGAGDLEEVPF